MKKRISIMYKSEQTGIYPEVRAYLDLLGVNAEFVREPADAIYGLLIIADPKAGDVAGLCGKVCKGTVVAVIGNITTDVLREIESADNGEWKIIQISNCRYSHGEIMRYLGLELGVGIIGSLPELESEITADGPEADIAIAAMNANGSSFADLQTLGDAFYEGKYLPRNPELAVSYYKRATVLGDGISAERVGVMLRDGGGIKPDPHYALDLFSAYAEKGCAWAMFRLGEMYGRGICVVESAKDMVDWYKRAAALGIPEAACRAARCYWLGIGVEQDRKTAIKYFKTAAEGGNAPACYYLGIYYEDPEQDDFNLETSVSYYKLAANQGYARAVNNLGGCYLHGHGVEKNEKTAFELFCRAADLGEVRSCYRAYKCLKDGVGTEKNPELAHTYLKAAAAYGHPEALCTLGREYESNKEYKSAADCFRLSAEGGNPEGQYDFGRCNWNGIGIERSREAAFEWFRTAADNNQKNAQYELGMCYLTKVGMVYDPVKAVNWFEKASQGEKGIPEAFYKLGCCLLSGFGTVMNPKRAIEMFNSAAERGNADALSMLGDCMYFGLGADKNPRQAVDYYRRAVVGRSVAALDMLGRCSECGEGTDKNRFEAYRLYRVAAKYGDCEGMYDAGRCLCEGIGVEKNVAQGLNLLQHSAFMGNISAILLLGKCFEDAGDINCAAQKYREAISSVARTPADFCNIADERAAMYITADDESMAEAMFRLARLCMKYEVEGTSAEQIYGYLGRAVLSEHRMAAETLNYIFTHGSTVGEFVRQKRNIPTFEDDSLPIFEDKKFAEIFNKLGEDYYFGDGMAENRAAAVKCYRIGANLGSAGAQFSYGWCLKNGTEIDKNCTEAVKWLKASAQSGCAEACFVLGECYEQGLGMSVRNRSEAAKWYAKAAKKGYTPNSEGKPDK